MPVNPPAIVRIDSYLWSIRLASSRSRATELCRGGHVKVAGASVKPAHPVHAGDRIAITIANTTREIEVVAPLAKRGGAAVAGEYYRDLAPPKERSPKVPAPFQRDPSMGRPTKRDRRLLDRLRNERTR